MEPSRYLRFVRALALGGALLAGCGEDDAPPPDQHGDTIADAGVDAPIDAIVPDVGSVGEGPLPPPDLPV